MKLAIWQRWRRRRTKAVAERSAQAHGWLQTAAQGGRVLRQFVQSGGSNNTQYNANTIYINRTYNEAPPEVDPTPISMIPFLRDPDFTHRPECGRLNALLKVPGSRIAIVGLGGVGYAAHRVLSLPTLTVASKSQVALEHCHQLRQQSSDTWVFWIHASNGVRFDEDITRLVRLVEPQHSEKTLGDTFDAVYQWLNDIRKGKWLLVLDSLDQADHLFDPPGSYLKHGKGRSMPGARTRWEYLPVCTHGNIIITSRSQDVASLLSDRRVAGSITDTICFHADRDHAAMLLQKKLEMSSSDPVIHELTEALDHIPLAITQAASYIKKSGSQCSAHDYLGELEKGDDAKIELLSMATNNLRRDIRDAQNAVLLTWRASFEHIAHTRPRAVALMTVLSQPDCQSTPVSSLRSLAGRTQEDVRTSSSGVADGRPCDEPRPFSSEDAEFEEDYLALKALSLISLTEERTIVSMSKLIQLAVRSWLEQTRTTTEASDDEHVPKQDGRTEQSI